MGLAETEQLIARALRGEGGDRGELLERLRPRLVLWSRSRLSKGLREKLEADDLAQDILVAVHRGFPGFTGRGPGEFYSWVFTIAENRLRDLADHYGALKRQVPEPRTFSQTSPSEHAARREQLDRVGAAIERLPDDYRRVIQLVRIEDRSAAEAGELMNRSANAVRILYYRAIRGLRAELNAS